ncbi:hypothetical protein [Streptomyces hygroscopicus]|uniref:hypothetical protein n=1 Tax=Streptomyces hygroscopicus TaxID=1912 RepID=UPI00223FD5B1|nr:hypothetical protein [Streptomyces hygroscopicus]
MSKSRPHENQTPAELKQSLAAVNQQAKQAAQTGPKKYEDTLHGVANDLLDEIKRRS